VKEKSNCSQAVVFLLSNVLFEGGKRYTNPRYKTKNIAAKNSVINEDPSLAMVGNNHVWLQTSGRPE
jgi:hypothetical protein